MYVTTKGKYLIVDGYDSAPSLFLGWRQRKGDTYYTVENNIVNRMVLGLPIELGQPVGATTELNQKLADYQKADVLKMVDTQHILNANPMGLGKTVETIEYLKQVQAKSVLIVCPKIVRQQWVDQIKTWWGQDAVLLERQRFLQHDTIYVVNYDKLRNESILDKCKSIMWDVVVLDEAHKIKNRKSKQTVAAKSLPAFRRIALTGTPILRYVDDLWSILHYLDWTYSGISYWNFVSYFCKVQETPWGNKIVGLTEDPEKVAILNKLLSLVSIRNNSVQVALGKTHEVVRLPMSKAQRELYRKEKALLLDELPENCTIANGAVLTTRLMQTTSWPGLFIQGEPGPKFEWVAETCLNNPKEKFVVFTVFAQTAVALQQYLESMDIGAVTITGQNTEEQNQAHKELFLKTKTQVIIGTIGAMGQGYDGLQSVSRLMIFLDRDWSPEIMKQAEDRLNRYGQSSVVNIYYLECQGSFDQHVGRINVNKADDVRRALDDTE